MDVQRGTWNIKDEYLSAAAQSNAKSLQGGVEGNNTPHRAERGTILGGRHQYQPGPGSPVEWSAGGGGVTALIHHSSSSLRMQQVRSLGERVSVNSLENKQIQWGGCIRGETKFGSVCVTGPGGLHYRVVTCSIKN